VWAVLYIISGGGNARLHFIAGERSMIYSAKLIKRRLIYVYIYIYMILIYLLTAIGLTPGGRSTVHIYIQKNT